MIRTSNIASVAFDNRQHSNKQYANQIEKKENQRNFEQADQENDELRHDQQMRKVAIQELTTDYMQQVEENEQEFAQNLNKNIASNNTQNGIQQLLDRYATEGIDLYNQQINQSHKLPLEEVEILRLMKLIPQSQLYISQIDNIVEQMLAQEDGNELATLNKFLSSFTNFGEIYLILEYILLTLKKAKKRKPSLLDEISTILDEFTIQQGSFLCEFFSLAGNDEIQKNLSGKSIQQLARANTSAITFSSVKQFIDFIKIELNDDFDNMLRIILKRKAQQLAEIEANNFENSYKMDEIIKLEHYMFVVYSYFLIVKSFKKNLGKHQIETINRNGDLLVSLLNFFESTMINKISLTNTLQTITLARPNDKQFIGIISQLIVLINKLPETLIPSQDQRDRSINSLRNVAKEIDDARKAKPTTVEFDFLHKKLKKVVEYV